jgi:lipopolysaccharide biosynthesis glycosyltransferase
MQANIIAAVPDVELLGNKRNAALKLNNHIYFNDGVLLIDNKKWNCANIVTKVMNVLADNPQKFRYLDQDALNLILTGKIHYLDRAWNRINSVNMNNEENIILLHFAAHPKPWNIAWPLSKLCNAFTKDIYKRYEQLTPWNEAPLHMPHNYKEMKIYAKCLWHNGSYAQGLNWYVRYIAAKL